MRLLKYDEHGELTNEAFDDDAIPPYAILSHTWGADTEEVTFSDLVKGNGKDKPGYKKIHYCGLQAQRDGLQYFWIDTCCINRLDRAELSLAIQSMFGWYQNAAKCYVYLPDVSVREGPSNSASAERTWELAFRSSRWFTRGWTLQELLAPRLVEFFCQEWGKLGDKVSLKTFIREITGIPHGALDGVPLSQFSVAERLRWKGDRETRREEDAWYCMSGLFDVEIAPAYSEGAASAFRRLMDEIHTQEKCIQDVRHTDPRDDKRRIEDTEGGLLVDSYRWVLDNTSFQQWQQDQGSRLLWVKGDPGKGKTMLLCGIIDQLHSSMPKTSLLSYFFCQATDARLNTATAVVRGLLYMLVDQQPSLVSHVRKKYDQAGRALFEDANAWVALTKIWADVLHDSGLRPTCLVIDALDECVAADLPKLLKFIAKQLSASSHVKWIVSSRNWPQIEANLERAAYEVQLSLELNAESVTAAVDVFIQQKVDHLAQEKQYQKELRQAVLQHLKSNANDTFLWVALVCQKLKATANRHVLEKLKSFPPGLDSLYTRMMQQVSESDDAQICRCVLASVAVLYRPVTVCELVTLVEQLKDVSDDVEEIIRLCGSFLTLREDTVYFVHQSAKEFLFAKAFDVVFPKGAEDVHRTIYSTSLAILSRTLHRDMYGAKALGCPTQEIKPPDPDPLAVSRYPCVYWIDHMLDAKLEFSEDDSSDLGAVDEFLRKKYLYWLEALSLCNSVGKGVVSMTKLWLLVQKLCNQNELTKLVEDARRFIMNHKRAIEGYPLQTYASALLFSPTGSLVRRLFQHEEPEGITIKPGTSDSWSACLLTLEGHSNFVSSVAFSHDSARLASASDDRTVKIWDAGSGACLQTLEDHSGPVSSVAFSHDSSRLASASNDGTVKIWDAGSGACLKTLVGREVYSVTLSPDLTQVALVSHDNIIRLWDVSSDVCLKKLEGHSRFVRSIVFSKDATKLASDDGVTKIWITSTGLCASELTSSNDSVVTMAFSHCSTILATAYWDGSVTLRNVVSRACIGTLKGHAYAVTSLVFSHDSMWLASASYDKTVKIWSTNCGECKQTLKSHIDTVTFVAFSHDSTRLATASKDRTVKIWKMSSDRWEQIPESHNDSVSSVAFFENSTRAATASGDNTIKIWDLSSGTPLETFEGYSHTVTSASIGDDSARPPTFSGNRTEELWAVDDPSSGPAVYPSLLDSFAYPDAPQTASSAAISYDSARPPTFSGNRTEELWAVDDPSYGPAVDQVLLQATASSDRVIGMSDTNTIISVAFSRDSSKLATASRDKSVTIWDSNSGACLWRFNNNRLLRNLFFDVTGSVLHTSIGAFDITTSPTSSTANVMGLQSARHQYAGISEDGVWITRNLQRILWVPTEYRPSCSAVSPKKLAIGVGSGKVWFCIFI